MNHSTFSDVPATRILAAIAVLTVLGCSGADARSPQSAISRAAVKRRDSTIQPAALSQDRRVPALDLTLVIGSDTVHLEGSPPLDSVALEVGAVPIIAGTHDVPWSICYVVGPTSDRAYLLFESDADMGTPDHFLDGYTLSRSAEMIRHADRCGRIAMPASSLRVGPGVRLGTRLAEVEERLGLPGSRKPGEYDYEYTKDLPRTPRPGELVQATSHTIDATLTIRFSGLSVTGISAGYLDSM